MAALVEDLHRRPTAKERLAFLNEQAESVYIDQAQSLIRYYNSSKQLYETARYEAKQGDNEKAYKLIMRFLDLYVTRIPKHPKYHNVPEEMRTSTKALCKKALDLGADLKQKLLAKYEEEIKLMEAEEQSRQQALRQQDDKSGDFDVLTDRINRLNAYSDEGASMGGGMIEGRRSSDQSSDGAWPTARIGTDVWGPTHLTNQNVDSPSAQPMIDRSTKPLPPPRRRIHSEDILRPVRVPADLVDSFARAAMENTRDKNIETCGNLWGVRKDGAYLVTHVLLPKQKGTDSYCEDLDEDEVTMFAISRDLIQLGWIHTHPSQTAFLSSVDMHMQHGYQIMLPEAIAIVLAPTFNDVGFFRLSSYGMEVLATCREGTNFHVHDEKEALFERVADVQLDRSLTTQLEDFRST